MNFLTRTQWNATPPPKGRFVRLSPNRVRAVVIHHSGVEGGPTGVAAVQAFERHHLSKGWDGIAYNWLVDETGTIFEGRGWEARGGATKGWNARSISICYTGWGYKQPRGPVLESIKTLIAEAETHFRHGLEVSTHRSKSSTTCPGDWLGDWVEGGMGSVDAPQNVDWGAIIRYFQDVRAEVDKRPLSRWARSRGLPVRLVQDRLRGRGFDPGPVDGLFGGKTAKAVKEFQGSQGFLKVNGVVNGDTFGALFLQ